MLIDLAIIVTKIAIVIGAIFFTVAYLILAERKVAGFIQERYGPNRVGFWGLLQPIADGVSVFFICRVFTDWVCTNIGSF